jgi:hypothetical protein
VEQNNDGARPRRKDGRSRPKKRSNGYIHRSPAVCVTVYDLSGRPMPDSDATEIVNSVFEIAMEKGYVINFTRT